MAAGVAALMRLNIVVAALATLLLPAIVLPVIFVLDYVVGKQILRAFGMSNWGSQSSFERTIAHSDMGWLWQHISEHSREFVPALVGFVVFLPLSWCAAYLATHRVMDILRERYRRKYKHYGPHKRRPA
jgi:uncharacterized protein (DUF2062 family)